jgi:hypothetical protein
MKANISLNVVSRYVFVLQVKLILADNIKTKYRIKVLYKQKIAILFILLLVFYVIIHNGIESIRLKLNLQK